MVESGFSAPCSPASDYKMASDKMAAPGFGCWWISRVHCLVNALVGLGSMPPAKESHCYSTLLLWARALRDCLEDRPSEVTRSPLRSPQGSSALALWTFGADDPLLWTGSASITGCVAATLTSTGQTPVAPSAVTASPRHVAKCWARRHHLS